MTTPIKIEDLLELYQQELRRGLIVLAVLSHLDQPEYGYSLIKQLGGKGFEVDQGTLYPLLRRLEERSLLESEWVVEDDTRPRKYYHISTTGTLVLTKLKEEWHTLVKVLEGVLE
ncbi:MAG TPA: PadR family transcriptional regulator [Anaerolineales bacterium]|nr:PadR family transcriptional regulator [Anaerolineales bacterium]